MPQGGEGSPAVNRCPYSIRHGRTILGERWFLRRGSFTMRRFTDLRAAERVRRALCYSWRIGLPESLVESSVEKKLAHKRPFREPGERPGYVYIFPGEG